MSKNNVRPVPGHPGYFVSECGCIWSDMRGVRKKLKPFENNKQYLRVDLYTGGYRTRYFVHRLVAFIWHGAPVDKKKTQVNHLRYNKHDNHKDSVAWCTPSENMKHARKRPYVRVWKSKEEAGTPF
jgi:hypothetical protein